MELAPGSMVLTHTSKYYHTDIEAEATTQYLMRTFPGPIIALAQNSIKEDKQWYGLPLDHIRHEFYSHAGEHELVFPKNSEKQEFHVWAMGGYFTACLGRTLSTLTANFIQAPKNLKVLILHLPMRAIFTGHLLVNGQLNPSTPYDESILDTSNDGLNLNHVLKIVPVEEREKFLRDMIQIAIYQKSPMMPVSQKHFMLEVRVDGKQIYSLGNNSRKKVIVLNFES